MSLYLENCQQLSETLLPSQMHIQRQASDSSHTKCEIIMDFSKLDEIDTFKDFIPVDKAEMTLLGAPEIGRASCRERV